MQNARDNLLIKPESEQLICVGHIQSAHGINGHLRVFSNMESSADICNFTNVWLEDKSKPISLNLIKFNKNSIIVSIDGINDRNSAEELKGKKLYLDKSDLPDVAEDEFYYSDLVGLQVFDSQKVQIGTVKAVDNFGAGDLLDIQLDGYSVYIPFLQRYVPSVSLQEHMVVIDVPQEMLEKPKALQKQQQKLNEKKVSLS